ncbi:MAG: efflux RND transporter periplasmic adaptor subunit [Gammaproteobacteria bacterium]|nr:MAG: efflux RND transporter periplasmic adaptor subunit [Gammaproteobacteria bacterium]
MKKKKVVIIVLMVLAISSLGVMKYRSKSMAADQEAVWVQASQVKETTLPIDVHAIGTLVARSADISPHVAEHVEKILFQDGVFVTQNTPLIQLDDAVYKAKYASAKAQLIYSENNYKRMALLGKVGAISKQAIDQADSEWKEKKADAEENEATLKEMTLYAPFDGVVGKCKVNPGDYVTEGQSMVTITDTKHLRVEYNVPEKYLPLLKLGQAVSITTEAYPGRTFAGTLAFIAPTINTDNRSISLYAEVPNQKNELAAGMFVDVTQHLGSDQRALVIPARSLVPMVEGEQVYKIVDGKAVAISVVVGRRMEDSVQVVQGLSANDQVITDGQLKVKNGVPVKVKS